MQNELAEPLSPLLSAAVAAADAVGSIDDVAPFYVKRIFELEDSQQLLALVVDAAECCASPQSGIQAGNPP